MTISVRQLADEIPNPQSEFKKTSRLEYFINDIIISDFGFVISDLNPNSKFRIPKLNKVL
jgi:hypothetical protein